DPHMPEKLLRAFGKRLKILVLFRHPVDMVVSMYRMQVRRGKIDQPFDRFLEEGLAWLAQARERHDPDIPVAAEILASGEYARVLKKYVDTFGWDNVHVAFFEELIRTPDVVLEGIQRHIGVRPLPLSLPHVNRGDVAPPVGWASRMVVKIEQGLRRYPRLRALLRTLTGPWRHEVIAWAYLRQVVRKPEVQTLDLDHRKELERLYTDEIRALRNLLGRHLPWDLRNDLEENGKT
ncbi:MAG: sulfotransferase domain-containing protein, partial [Candidatus Hydrothermae bacterium]|nr:sulfotransferase domain-containing protein [Candidatus Hydrothermae bacterium]